MHNTDGILAYDIFVIGGGINGTAITADAAGRGLSVILCEKGDLACGTSSASTKLIHGGLRYLELYEFNLVRKALHECDVLMNRAPNLISPLEFVLPYENHLRPAWLIRLGLFFYDHLAKRERLPSSKSVNFQKDSRGAALLSSFKKGFSYYDCFTDDSRLVVLNALSAKDHGAEILTHTQFISAQRENGLWKIEVKANTGEIIFYSAKTLINVAGPYVRDVQKNIIGSTLKFNVELVKGSHIVVPKLYAGDFAYILQNADNRIVFAIPYENDFTLIGTTDVAFQSDLNEIKITPDEINYLCNTINHYFKKHINPADIIWSYAGVRCLRGQEEENLSKITRDYQLLLEDGNEAPLLTVIGGKLTTHRILAEDVLSKLQKYFPTMGKSWTADSPLPGSDFASHHYSEFYKKFSADYPWLPESITQRYAKNYGTRAYLLLENTHSMADLGEDFSTGLYQKEIEYLIKHEWAKTSEDILWRRTKLGLTITPSCVKKLDYLLV